MAYGRIDFDGKRFYAYYQPSYRHVWRKVASFEVGKDQNAVDRAERRAIAAIETEAEREGAPVTIETGNYPRGTRRPGSLIANAARGAPHGSSGYSGGRRPRFRVGDSVRIAEGSGVLSRRTGVIVPRSEVRTDGSGVPTNIAGHYKPVNWRKEVAIRLDDGELVTMFKDRLQRFDKFQLNAASDVRNLDYFAEKLDLPEWDFVYEGSIEWLAECRSTAEREAREEAEYNEEEISEDELEVIGIQAEETCEQALYRSWHDAVEGAASELLREHDLELSPVKEDDPLPFEYEIVPETTWQEAAKHLAMTIEGVGIFSVDLDEEAADEESARDFVLSHLAWIAYHPEVYEGPSAQRLYERYWRDP